MIPLSSDPRTDRPVPSPSRRNLLKGLLGFSVISTAAGVLTPIISYLLPASPKGAGYTGPTMVGEVGDFPVNTGKVVVVNDKPVIVVNTSGGGIKAFSAICTHLGCVVEWDKKKSVIHSPCHDGLFNAMTGAVIGGPPPRPLPAYELTVKEGRVHVGKPLGQIYGT